MQHRLHGLALRLRPWKSAIAAIALLFLAMAAYALMTGGGRGDLLLRTGILGVMWAGWLFSCLELFQHLPRQPRPQDRYHTRLGLRARRGFYSLLSAVVVLLAVLLLWMSVKLAFL